MGFHKKPIATRLKIKGKDTTKKERVELAKSNKTIVYKQGIYKVVGKKNIKKNREVYKIPENAIRYLLVEKSGLDSNTKDLPMIIEAIINSLQNDIILKRKVSYLSKEISLERKFSSVKFLHKNNIWIELMYVPMDNLLV